MKVLICGIKGRMGSCTADAVMHEDDMELVGGVDQRAGLENELVIDDVHIPLYTNIDEAIAQCAPDCMVDFTHPTSVEGNVRCALAAGVSCIVGTTGLSREKLEDIYLDAKPNTALFVAPNFTTGAVLMMEFSRMAAKYFPDIEIIEFHHDGKADSPSGTAINTAHMIAAARTQPTDAPGRETELDGMDGARGALVDGVPVHSVRTNGYVAHQEVIFGSKGQTLTIRHDSIDRTSYMPGVLLAIRKIGDLKGLTIGLEKLMS